MKEKANQLSRKRRSFTKGSGLVALLLGLSCPCLEGTYSDRPGCQSLFQRLAKFFSLSKVKDIDQRFGQPPFQGFALISKQNGHRSPGKLFLEATLANLAAPGSAIKATPGYFLGLRVTSGGVSGRLLLVL